MYIDPNKVYMRDFQFLKELGKGGFGSVFLVRITDAVREKIIKELLQKNYGRQIVPSIPEIVAFKKVYMGQSVSQAKM